MPCPDFPSNFLLEATRTPSPCFVLDEARLAANAAVLDNVQRRTGARILLALKAFAVWSVFPLLSRHKGTGPLWGVCASSVDEARLGREEFGGEVHAYAPAWTEREIDELCGLADHIVFNSIAQWQKFRPKIAACNGGDRGGQKPVSCGLRVNPEHSEVATPLYDPCAPGSRLGMRQKDFDANGSGAPDGIDGLHFHTLCELGADALARTLAVVEKKFAGFLRGRAWINMGGGHHITKPGYDIDLLCRCLTSWRERYGAQLYLEPGEAVALDAGWLAATVLDVVDADMPVVVLDVSAACHTPDVLEMPYRPRVLYAEPVGTARAGLPGEKAWSCRLAGKSCLAGDVFGEYSFAAPLTEGQRLVFEDMAIYSMVKTTTFNGVRLPSIGLWDGEGFRLQREFGYADFRGRLS
ncbi:MAG: carboxynorspermidine decarboxylase [Desulfovibrio sp.]|jgi:carboxynorspermidine decarboxylase|nr:carboxynorspermidine decarboxylase [Desulfovibrio sp.]